MTHNAHVVIAIRKRGQKAWHVGRITKYTRKNGKHWVYIVYAEATQGEWVDKEYHKMHVLEEPEGHNATQGFRVATAPSARLVSVPKMTGSFRVLEAFCGTGRVAAACTHHGATALLVDKDRNQIESLDGSKRVAVLEAPWQTVPNEELLNSGFHCAHFSPPCATFSSLARSTHKRSFANNYLGNTKECYESNADVVKMVRYIREAMRRDGGFTYTIENPKTGDMIYHPLMKQARLPYDEGGIDATLVEVHYCFFCERGKEVNKPTYIWTNNETFVNAMGTCDKAHFPDAPDSKYICGQGSRCRTLLRGLQHKSVTERFNKNGVAAQHVAALPYEFADQIGRAFACHAGAM